MEENKKCIGTAVMITVGILLLMAAAFDILPFSDNQVIFAALACFIIAGLVKKISKGSGSCCK